jgi:hypothetical protein
MAWSPGFEPPACRGGNARPQVAELGRHHREVLAHRFNRAGKGVVFADERGNESGRGIVVDLAAGAHLLDHPVAHHRDPVRHGQGLALVMGDVDEGEPDLLLDGAQFGAHVLAQLQVERRQRLVEQQHARFGGERAGDRHPLLLAARQFVDVLVALIGQRDQIEQFLGPLAPLGHRPALDLERKGDVLPHPHEREQGEVLEDQRGGPQIGADARHVAPADADLAGGGLEKARNGPEDRRLAAARGAEKGEELARLDRNGCVAHRDEVAEVHRQPAQIDAKP